MYVTEANADALGKKLFNVISLVLNTHHTITNPKTKGFLRILDAKLKLDDNNQYYIHVDLYIKSYEPIVYHQGIEGSVVNWINSISNHYFKETVKVKVRDYTLIVDQDIYEIIYTKKVRKKE